jgi:hypothetical protein
MIKHLDRLFLIAALGTLAAACAPRAATPSADVMATTVAQAAFDLMTQTAAAASPTPPPPTETVTPTPTVAPTETPTSAEPPRRPQTVADGVECWLGGPGAPNTLETHINHGKAVDLLGIGNTPGWYVIRDPYFHRPCWILATDLKFFQEPDPSKYPVMTPGVPGQGQ